ncbi:iron-containing alcohol dehydrogenase [Oceanobacillus caeni]|uniref:iron-containing alcohol dehydrogenase n=1 Tax=Oceanobacillus caeni TaxID=405946 RepID=UPI003642A2F9
MKYSNCNKSIHGIAHPLSAHCGLPHEIANATTLPYVMEFNGEVPEVQTKFKDIARIMGFDV